jgi:signal transduction histidine kinase
VEFSTLVRFSKLVADSRSSEEVFSLLGKTVVEQCCAFHALVFGTSDSGDFRVLSSYGRCDAARVRALELDGVCTLADLRTVIGTACGDKGYEFRVIPLISEAGLFGALAVMYSGPQSLTERQWALVEGLTDLTAISLNKAYQHQKLQKAFDELRASQEALIRSEKFRALGQMSAGIAHDLKNILNPLLLYTDVLRDEAGNRQEVIDVSERIERILNRGLETVERLRDFSRQSPEESEVVSTDLNGMAREALEISKPRLNGIHVDVQLGEPPAVLIRPADCVAAIVNLVLNSADALEGKGVIRVATGGSDGGSWIEVADDGPGMSAEIKSRVLEPFFTTKGDAGTGLGLSIVYAFTIRHGGRLEIESEAGHGARFRMWFPFAPQTARAK